MKKWSLFFCLLVTFCFPPLAFGQSGDVLINETFTTRTMVDGSKTTAVVDTTKQEVRLPQVNGSQSITSNLNGTFAINNGSLDFFRDDGSGHLVKDMLLSHPISSNPIAATLDGDGYDHYVLSPDGKVTYYRYTGSSFVADPAYQISGFSSALSIAKSKDSLFVLDNHQVRVFKPTDSGIIEVPPLNILLNNIENPIQISTLGEDLVVLDGNQNAHYYRLGTSYNEDPSMEVFGAGTSIDAKSGNLETLKTGDFQQYQSTSTSFIQNAYATFHDDTAYSVAGNEDGSVMVRDNSGLSKYVLKGNTMVLSATTALASFQSSYLSPRDYESLDYTWANPTKRIQVKPTETLPPGTTIDLSVSGDHGSTFFPVDATGFVNFSSPINSLIIHAGLKTTDPTQTPVLKGFQVLDETLSITDFETTAIVRDPGGNPPLPTPLPCRVVGGYAFDMQVNAPGATQVTVQFSNGESASLTNQSGSIFVGSHFFPADATGSIDATVIAADSSGDQVQKVLPAQYLIVTNIMQNAVIYDVK
jgi:hypothetical protein